MATKRLTDEDVKNIHNFIHDEDRYVPQWRKWCPVNPFGPPAKKAHFARFYKMKAVPNGIWSFFKDNAGYEGNHITGYTPADRYYWSLILPWELHKNDVEVNDRIQADSILQIRKRMENQIEKLLINGGRIESTTVIGLLNNANVQSGTAGNGNGMTEIYNLIKELKNKLTAENFVNKNNWWFVHDATIDQYLDLINATFGETARTKLEEAGILNEARMHLAASGQITPDTSDAAMFLIEVNPEHFYMEELTNGVEVGVLYDGALADGLVYKGWLEWAGVLIDRQGKSVAKNTGVASA
jgi:hypothetical protein